MLQLQQVQQLLHSHPRPPAHQSQHCCPPMGARPQRSCPGRVHPIAAAAAVLLPAPLAVLPDLAADACHLPTACPGDLPPPPQVQRLPPAVSGPADICKGLVKPWREGPQQMQNSHPQRFRCNCLLCILEQGQKTSRCCSSKIARVKLMLSQGLNHNTRPLSCCKRCCRPAAPGAASPRLLAAASRFSAP